MVDIQRGWSALRGWLLGLVVALCIVAGLAAPARAEASVYTVNSTTDAADAIRGADDIWGGDGRDLLVDGLRGDRSTDYLYGGWGNDTINTNNKPNHLDYVKCGPGFDKLIADANDRFLGNPNACEDVRVY